MGDVGQAEAGEEAAAGHSQTMAIIELKFPMLKHSRATSMKNSSIRVRCFFFTTWGHQQPSVSTARVAGLPPPILEGHLLGVAPGPTELSDSG